MGKGWSASAHDAGERLCKNEGVRNIKQPNGAPKGGFLRFITGLLAAFSLWFMTGSQAFASLSVNVSATPDPVIENGNLTYTITVSAVGTANNVAVSDPLPAGLTFVSLSASAGWSCTTPAIGGSGTVSCSVLAMTNEAATFTLTAGVPAVTMPTTVTNTVSANASNPFNASGSVTTTINPATPVPDPVTVARPDPAKNVEVIGLLNAQTAVTKRFAMVQIGNLQSRLEALHSLPKTAPADRNRDTSSAALPSASRYAGQTLSATHNTVRANRTATDLAYPNQFIGANDSSPPQRSSGQLALSIASSSAGPVYDNMSLWSAGVINIGKQDSNGQDDHLEFSTSGISAGTDARVKENLWLGFALGYGKDRTDIGNNDSTNRATANSVAIYTSSLLTEHAFFDALLGYGWIDLDGKRYLADTGDFARLARDATQWFGSFSGGYEDRDDNRLLGIYARLDLASTRLKQAGESASGSQGLTYFGETMRTARLSLGARGEYALAGDYGVLQPRWRVEYQHALDSTGTATIAYSDQLSGPFYQIAGDDASINTLVGGVGATWLTKGGYSIGLEYQLSRSFDTEIAHQFALRIARGF